MLEAGLISHVYNEHAFKNKYLFYVFTIDQYVFTPPWSHPLAMGILMQLCAGLPRFGALEANGGLWRTVGGCAGLWSAADSCAGLCRALRCCGGVCMEGCEGLWRAVKGCGGLWGAVGRCGWLWRVIEGCVWRLREVVSIQSDAISCAS